MTRKRRNDPPGLSDSPRCVTDPARVREMRAEATRRMGFIEQSYRIAVRAFGNGKRRNDTLRQIRRAYSGKVKPGGARVRADQQTEMVISFHARKFARERAGVDDARVECEDVERAVERTLADLKILRGPPLDHVLRHHVEGFMALLQDYSGRPVLAARKLGDDHYEPHFKPGVSAILPAFFQRIDPSIQTIRLVDIVLDARQKYAGHRKRFADYFPLYGARMMEDGTITSPLGYRVEHFEPNIPIYFSVPPSG
jgi:hypothetical protein